MSTENTDTKTVTSATFAADMASMPVALVDLWAPWCGPCRVIAPVIDEIASEYKGRVFVGKLNVDDEPEAAARFNVRSIPTILLFKDGSHAGSLIGAVNKAAIVSNIKRLLGEA